MVSKKFIYLSLVILLFYLLGLGLFNNLKNSKINEYLENYTSTKQKQYEVVYNSFRKLAINSFYGVVQKQDIIDIYKQLKNDGSNDSKIRKELYKILKKDYRRFKMLGIKYLHFHLPNGKVFLRMENRKEFGDDISSLRPSIKHLNDTKLPFEGIEEGGDTPAFRFVYPLFDKNNYLGSAEVSFDILELKNVFERSFKTSVNIIFKTSALQNNSYRKVESDYEISKENNHYLIRKGISKIEFNDVKQLDQNQIKNLKKEADTLVEFQKSFSLSYYHDDISKVVTFLPQINEVSKEVIAYLVTYDDDHYIKSLHEEFVMIISGSFLMFLLFLYIVYSEIKKQDILEKLVKKKTKEIRKLYNHELYLKSLLETVANVNESLITSYSLGSIIQSSLLKLQEHKSYRLIAYGHISNKKIHTRYIQGDKYSLIKEELLDCSSNIKGHILQGAIDSVNQNKTTINNNIDFDKYNIITKREDDYVLKSSISLLLKSENNELFGVLTLFSENNDFDKEEISLLETLASDISMAISVSRQRKMVEKLQLKQIANYEETILAFVDMIEHRDAYTAGHTLRVAKYCRLIASRFDIEEKEIAKLEKAAILHDIGKIATPDTILLKPGRLTNLEYSLIKEHVNAGFQMLSKVELYKDLAQIIKYHHEHYDGTGYPHNKKGDEIPFLAHILITADAFDAMTTNRIYKSRLSPKEAVEEILRNSGTQFHPKVAIVASEVLKDVDIEQTTQLPKTSLEKQRFAYFFNDNLTNVYNEQYLELILNSPDEYKSLNKIELKKMSLFNRKVGWDKGNKLLVDFATYLQKKYENSLIFRYQGDDFIVLSKERIYFDVDDLDKFFNDYETVSYDINFIDTKDHNFKSFKNLIYK